GTVGCRLTVSRAGEQILPRASAFPAPFSNLFGGSGTVRLAPVLIGKGQAASGSDALVVMSGNAAGGDVSRPLRNPGPLPANELRLDNTVGIGQNDLVLMSQPGTDDCLLEQIGAPTSVPDSIAVAGTYAHTEDPF